jgi:hypothetical protein
MNAYSPHAQFTEAQFVAAGFNAPFYRYLKEISSDESIHVDYLTAAITAAGGKPVKECVYSFGATSVELFVAISSILEGVGKMHIECHHKSRSTILTNLQAHPHT